jgi:CBS domain-containing protein
MREAIASSHLHLPIMALNPAKPVCLEQGLPVSVAIQAMYTHGIGSVLVLDGEILVGVFTEKDVLTRVLPRRHEMESAPLLEVMTQNPECLQQDDSIAYALNTMSVGRYRHVPLVDDYCRPSGVISVRDIFRYLEEVTRSNAVGPR